MFSYYFQLGLRSLRRNPVLTALMVLGIALGIAASMTTLTVMHVMGSDPIPWKSDKLHYVQLDNWDVNNPYYDDGRPPDQVTYRDAIALMEAGKADKQAAMFKIALPIQPENPRGQAVPIARPSHVFGFLRACSSRRSRTAARGIARRTRNTRA